ncbi:MAG: phosphate ABC transporter substrate-binding protein [Ignavibacteria bacterium]
MKKILLILLVIIGGCYAIKEETDVIRIKGSDTMRPLTENLAREFMRLNGNVSIYVLGGGTSTGIESLINGKVEISTASRLLKPGEQKLLSNYYQSVGMYFLVAKDGLSVYVNLNNPVENVSLDQLRKIYNCEITNWKQLGGNDAEIDVIIRTPNSGTHYYFKEHVMNGEEYCGDLTVKSSIDDIIDAIAKDKNAIGFGGIGYSGNVKHLKINDVYPSEENVLNDTYPISRYLHFFTTRSPSGNVRKFIDWVMGSEGQEIIRSSGYIPLFDKSY